MVVRPRVLVIDDIVGSDREPRDIEYRRTYCERLGRVDTSGRVFGNRQRDVVAEATFCSGQSVDGAGATNNLLVVEDAFRSGWPADARYWSAVLVDMKFGDDERFGLEVIRTLRSLSPEVPIIVVSSLNQMRTEAGETLRHAAERVGAHEFLAAPGGTADVEERYHSTPENLRERLNELGLLPDPDQIVVGTSLAMCQTLLRIRQRARDPLGQALLLGESGSGKTHLAEYVRRQIAHQAGARTVVLRRVSLSQNSGDMQKVQLFGTDGATMVKERPGAFEEAGDGGVVFLDELGELKEGAQGDLLSVLQVERDASGRRFRVFTRDGSPRVRQARCFVLAATHKTWRELQAAFDPALLMRFEQGRVNVPTLRERKEDLPALVDYFLRQVCARRQVVPELEVPRAAWEQYADTHTVRQLHDLIDDTVSTNPFKLFLTEADIFGRSASQYMSARTMTPNAIDGGPTQLNDPSAATSVESNSVSQLVNALEGWHLANEMSSEEIWAAFTRLDAALASVKLRLWRDLILRQKRVAGSANLKETVRQLLGKDDVAKSKPADLAHQVFSDAQITSRPDDPVLAELWDRRRYPKKSSGG